MKATLRITIIGILFAGLVSCQKNSRPNFQYMPNMYESVGYEAYQESDAFANGIEAQIPAEGSIPRGYKFYEIENSTEGYQLAKAELKNPVKEFKYDQPRAKELYEIYCGICHGNRGNGKGKLVEREKILGVPSYDDVGRAITEGSVYHVVYYGLNTMGAYKNQLNEEERWQVTTYVMELKAELEK